jgi:YfiH family protein
MNLGTHVEDDLKSVQKNRQILSETLNLEESPFWLNQIHSNIVSNLDSDQPLVDADAALTRQLKRSCIVMTADCLPVLFCNSKGTVVAASHAGWRGLEAGILEKTVNAMQCSPETLLAWLGPAIGASVFEVGDEVRHAFMQSDSMARHAFKAHGKGKWLADIYQLATLRLNHIGLQKIYGGGECTYSDPQHFYSYRREAKTGRMASLIWMD